MIDTRKIAILGGTGFIGFHLAKHLVKKGETEITLVDNLSRGRLDTEVESLVSTNPGVNFVEADLTSAAAYESLGQGFEQVYLLAGIVGVRNAEERPDRVAYVNSMVVLLTLEWLKTTSTKLVYASTSEAYSGAVGHDPRCAIPTAEDTIVSIEDVTNPRSTYAASKILGETAVLAYNAVHGQDAAIVRFHNVYGPRMGYDHVVPELSMRLLEGVDPCVVFGCDQSRAFCFVDDAVAATAAVMESDDVDGEIFHVGTDHEISIEELARTLCEVADRRPELAPKPAPAGSVKRRCPDISKARARLGYEPATALRDGLTKTFEWYARQKTERVTS